jgi:hypothetical protein
MPQCLQGFCGPKVHVRLQIGCHSCAARLTRFSPDYEISFPISAHQTPLPHLRLFLILILILIHAVFILRWC